MRVPVCLEDRDLLEEEPFSSSFSTRRRQKKNLPPTHFLESVVTRVEKAPGGIHAVDQWVNMAFDLDESQFSHNRRLRSDQRPQTARSRPSRKKLMCFVKFYWYLFSNQDALRFLGSQKLGGYTRKFDYLPVKQEPYDDLMSPLTELADDEDIPASLAIPTALELEPKQEPYDDPMSPLTELADDEDISASLDAIPTALEPIPPIVSPAPALEISPQSTLRLTSPPETKFVLPSLATSGNAPETAAYTTPNSPAVEPESTPIVHTRVGGNPCRGAGPSEHSSAHGSAVLQWPAKDDTSPRPSGPFSAPPSRHITQIPAHPVHESRSNQQARNTVMDCPDVKPEPSEEGPEPLRLLNPGELSENWLTLPVKDTAQSDESPMLDLVSQSPCLPKPPLKCLPPIWAQSRQEVCESFEWFRSYQGGVYQNNRTVKGYFLSAFSAQRDCFECGGKIIISHGGGKAETSRTQKGEVTTKAAEDQRAQDLSVRALLENYRRNQPLVLLIDDKYRPFPFDLGSRDVYMTVLGFYKIIHAWAEYQPSRSNTSGRVVRYKFAFQWCEDQGQPWWSNEHSDLGPSPPTVVEASAMVPAPMVTSPLKPANLYFRCNSCSEKSPRVYRQAWACLNPVCSSFWTTASGQSLPDHLDYNPEFLTIIDFRALPLAYRNALLPRPPGLAPKDGITTTYAHSRGFHCRKCGRLSSRFAWEHYQCPNCKDTQAITGSIREAKHLMSIRAPIGDKCVDSVVEPGSFIQRLGTRMFDHTDTPGATGRYQTFVLPEGKGKIHLIQTNRMANLEADRIFELYQTQASEGNLLFRRWPLRSHKLRGPLLTNYFSQNSGETYHYVGGADNTTPFDRAPTAVTQARNLIQKRIHEALGAEHKFNEVLSVAYMEQQKMAFHSDSERGLGPVVAGLSMGSPALMYFRLLSKHAPKDQQRANAMTVVLRHGDVLVMEGAGVQDFYEHTVVPCNFRIAATARWISPNHA
ncbi:hypothetical protein DFH07DRAFT_816306 [Mycena maculata]|uniref:Alpha-ketoglutarate-dependent dioxygenase AlkB-like domain-containing protein n=1 Tax=Mycena maculata TaxID=230809 RepID=A0AAD7NHV4_9AGAR|nr:hypothetical protein DFH07DRAFT_816306 [Mycena maculata]